MPQRENLSSASGRCMICFRGRKHLICEQEALKLSTAKKGGIKRRWAQYHVSVPTCSSVLLVQKGSEGLAGRAMGATAAHQTQTSLGAKGSSLRGTQWDRRHRMISPESCDWHTTKLPGFNLLIPLQFTKVTCCFSSSPSCLYSFFLSLLNFFSKKVWWNYLFFCLLSKQDLVLKQKKWDPRYFSGFRFRSYTDNFKLI